MSDECYTAHVMISMFSPGFEVVKLGRYWLSKKMQKSQAIKFIKELQCNKQVNIKLPDSTLYYAYREKSSGTEFSL